MSTSMDAKHDVQWGCFTKCSPPSTADTLVDLDPFMRSVRSLNSYKIRFTSSRRTPRGRSAKVPTLPPSSKRTAIDDGLTSGPAHLTSNRSRNFHTRCRSSAMQEDAPRSLDDEVSPKHTIELPDPDTTLEEVCEVLDRRVQEFLDTKPATKLLEDLQAQVRVALKVLEEALERYSLEELAFSYNGGKDCLVLLVLYLVSIHKHSKRPPSSSTTNSSQHTKGFPNSLASVYIQHPNSFFEVDEFVRQTSAQYHLSLTSSAKPMKEAFGEYLQQHPNVKAIFVGTRRTDPFGDDLTNFDPTDRGWPSFMRIHPVIDWHYREIWAFIRHFEIPYCSLYDLGYTSLGGTKDTHPNPKLKKEDSTDKLQFRPAFELVDDDEERLGRDRRSV